MNLGPERPLALPEPEPTQPFDLSLSEPTYQTNLTFTSSLDFPKAN